MPTQDILLANTQLKRLANIAKIRSSLKFLLIQYVILLYNASF